MMIKIIGMILIITGSALIGNHMAERYRIRICMLEEWQEALQYLYGEIEYSAADASESSKYYGKFFGLVWEEMQKKDGKLFFEIWRACLDDIEKFSLLQKEDKRLLEEFGRNMGNLDRFSQLHMIEIYQERVKHQIEDARLEYTSQTKVCRILGITAGIFMSIVLV